LAAAVRGAAVATNRQSLGSPTSEAERTSERIASLLERTASVMQVTLLGSTVGLVLTTIGVAGLLARTSLFEPSTVGWLIALLLLTPAIAVLDRGVARSWGRQHADRALGTLASPLMGLRVIVWPIERLSAALTELGLRFTRSELPGPQTAATVLEEEVKLGVIPETDERRMIHRILMLNQTSVSEIMRPLIKVVAIAESELSQEHVAALARETGHSRFPIYRTYIFNMIGHVDVYDVLQCGAMPPKELRSLVHRPHFVPETKPVDDLLEEFLRERRRLALVIDEHGACSGLVTLEDILEEIFGEIEDEFDRERPAWQMDDQGRPVIEAGTDLDDVSENFGLAFPDVRSDTLGGFIYESLGRVPRVGETVAHGEHLLRVVEMNVQQIVRVRLEPASPHAL
jgi:CBS domain containing-hemolysin-like protein